MRRKGWIAVFLAINFIQPVTAQAVSVNAASAVLMDAESGRVLYEKNAHEPRMIASITKLMTALVALESGHDPSEIVVIQPQWTGVEGSSLYLRTGESYQLETLLYGLLMHSGNDAAEAIAGYCSQSKETFIAQMNQKAQQLGMMNSHFLNPSGLTQEGHYSSAYDMAVLARACLNHELLSKIVATKSITLEGKTFTNHNKLLWRYDGCIGMKTGYTEKAGRTLVSAAQRDGMTLICVTLHDPDDWKDHEALFEYGFSSCHSSEPIKSEEVVGFLPVEGSLCPMCPLQASEGLSVALRDDEEIEVELEYHDSVLTAPLPAGAVVGRIICRLNGTELYCTDLITARAVDRNAVQDRTLHQRLLELCGL